MKIDQKKLEAFLERFKPQTCPVCHKGTWIAGDIVFYLNEYHEDGSVVIGGPSFPVIPIVCSECGNTIFINTIITKLTNQPQEVKNDKV